jgi:hypothetical protein
MKKTQHLILPLDLESHMVVSYDNMFWFCNKSTVWANLHSGHWHCSADAIMLSNLARQFHKTLPRCLLLITLVTPGLEYFVFPLPKDETQKVG